MTKPTVLAKKVDSCYQLFFDYNKAVVDAIRCLPEYRYLADKRIWKAPESLSHKNLIQNQLEQIACIEFSKMSKNDSHHIKLFLKFCSFPASIKESHSLDYFTLLAKDGTLSVSFQNIAVNAVQLYYYTQHTTKPCILSKRTYLRHDQICLKSLSLNAQDT